MHIGDLPERTQEYLKVIWDISEYGGQTALPGEIARRVGQKSSTVSEAIKRLASQGLVTHEPYSGITLTEQGNAMAVQMVRRHRVLETFLVRALGYTWDEVHEDADLLEHAVSDRLLERMEEHLHHPTHDPHGDPIPHADGTLPDGPTRTLADVSPNEEVTIAQVDDHDPELLRYLADNGLTPGVVVTVESPLTAGVLRVRTGKDQSVALGEATLTAIRLY